MTAGMGRDDATEDILLALAGLPEHYGEHPEFVMGMLAALGVAATGLSSDGPLAAIKQGKAIYDARREALTESEGGNGE